jgi:hypothetical protein
MLLFRQTMKYTSFLVVILFLGIAGCAEKHPVNTSAAKITDSAKSLTEEPTDEECKIFVQDFLTAFQKEDHATLKKLIDIDAIVETSTEGLDILPETKNTLFEGTLKGLTGPTGVFQQIHDQLARGGSYRFIHIHYRDGRKWLLFRWISDTGAANYHDFILHRKTQNGDVSIADYFTLSSSERISDAYRRIAMRMVAEDSNSVLNDKDRLLRKFLPNTNKMAKSVQVGNFSAALEIYDQLPYEVRQDKIIMMSALLAAQKVSEETYNSIARDFIKNYPNDPGADYLCIDYYFFRKEYVKGFDAMQRVDKFLGGDAYMKFLGATACILQDKYVDAHDLAQQAIEKESDFLLAYKLLLTISIEEKKFDESVHLLDVMNQKCNAQIKELEEAEYNAGFLQSPQYQKWKEKQAAL